MKNFEWIFEEVKILRTKSKILKFWKIRPLHFYKNCFYKSVITHTFLVKCFENWWIMIIYNLYKGPDLHLKHKINFIILKKYRKWYMFEIKIQYNYFVKNLVR